MGEGGGSAPDAPTMERLTQREVAALRHVAHLARHPRAKPSVRHIFSLWDLYDRLVDERPVSEHAPQQLP